MSADLERKVREAAEQALDKKRSLLEWTDNAYLYGDGYRDGYLAAATLREKEIAAKDFEIERISKLLVATVTDADKEIATLRARVAELEGMVPKWVLAITRGECGRLLDLGWRSMRSVWSVQNDCSMLLMVPPIPVPETKP